MAVATITSKGQITLPKAIRERLSLSTGDRIEFIEVAPGRYEIVPLVHDIRSLKGLVGPPGHVASLDEMNHAIAQMGRP